MDIAVLMELIESLMHVVIVHASPQEGRIAGTATRQEWQP